MKREVFWFGVVGSGAMITHFLLVLWLVPFGWQPLTANVIAYMVAFQVRYWGHRLESFDAGDLSHRQRLRRFFLVASLGFALNEGLYFVLLRYSAMNYRAALLLVLLAVALLTFILSRNWAFAGEKSRPSSDANHWQ